MFLYKYTQKDISKVTRQYHFFSNPSWYFICIKKMAVWILNAEQRDYDLIKSIDHFLISIEPFQTFEIELQ